MITAAPIIPAQNQAYWSSNSKVRIINQDFTVPYRDYFATFDVSHALSGVMLTKLLGLYVGAACC